MKLEPGKWCPLIKEDCVGLKCTFMTQLRGTDPQTGKEVDEWFCAIAALPMLLIENAKEVRQGAAATESFRNEVTARADLARLQQASIPQFTHTLIGGK
jgi:hypothetical protein